MSCWPSEPQHPMARGNQTCPDNLPEIDTGPDVIDLLKAVGEFHLHSINLSKQCNFRTCCPEMSLLTIYFFRFGEFHLLAITLLTNVALPKTGEMPNLWQF